ncbi:hypothetical protein ACAG26_06725 [Mycobacterium sp. pUA109]|uniref:hypothetical protein n=1 Tax=Mycobacterium sp. pUA109 TaxID=3238982 RepID=UPI00351AF7FA
MTNEWSAELARLRAERGAEFVAESARRGVGERMLADAMRAIDEAEFRRLMGSTVNVGVEAERASGLFFAGKGTNDDE